MSIHQIALGQFQRLRIASFWLIAALLCGFVLFFHSGWAHYQPLGIDIEEIIEITGLGLIGIAIAGRLWCTLYIGGRKAAELVEDGPYSITRNPLYLFSTIGAMGVGAQTGSIVVAVICGVLAAFILSITTRREEHHLRETFGEAYDAYLARVPAFIPNPKLFHDPKTLTILPERLYGTLRDGLIFFLAMPAFELVEYVQDLGLLPILFRLY